MSLDRFFLLYRFVHCHCFSTPSNSRFWCGLWPYPSNKSKRKKSVGLGIKRSICRWDNTRLHITGLYLSPNSHHLRENFVFSKLKNLWKSSGISRRTKISYVLSVLMYGAECWKMTERDINKLSSFHNGCLRKILIFWPAKISN